MKTTFIAAKRDRSVANYAELPAFIGIRRVGSGAIATGKSAMDGGCEGVHSFTDCLFLLLGPRQMVCPVVGVVVHRYAPDSAATMGAAPLAIYAPTGGAA